MEQQPVRTGNDTLYRTRIDGGIFAKSLFMQQQDKPAEQPKIDKEKLKELEQAKQKAIKEKQIVKK